MKLKWVGSSFITFSLVLIIILFYLQSLLDSGTFTQPENNQNVPFPTDLHPIVKERSNELIQQSATSRHCDCDNRFLSKCRRPRSSF